MRKISTIIACTIMSMLQAQIVPVTIIETSPEIVCSGDTLQARFVFNQPPQSNQPFRIAARLDRSNITLIDTVFTGMLSQLIVVDTVQVGLVYGVKVGVPLAAPAGQYSLTGNINVPAQTEIMVNRCHAVQPYIIAFSKDTVCPTDSICITVVNPDMTPFYINFESSNVLTWNPVYPLSGEDTTTVCLPIPGWLALGTCTLGTNLISDPTKTITLWCSPCHFNMFGPDTVCINSPKTFSALGAASTYTWGRGNSTLSYSQFFTFPTNMPTGTFNGPGIYKLQITGQTGTCIMTRTITIDALYCDVSIPVYYLDDEKNVEYFDLFGNKTERKPGFILIEQKGNVRRKIFIQE